MSLNLGVMRSMFDPERRIAELAAQRPSMFTRSVVASIDKLETSDKNDRTPVTVSDLKARALVISALRAHFSQDTLITEESASVPCENPTRAAQVQRMISSFHLDDAESEIPLARLSVLQEML